jgi:cytidylate kinase
MAVLTLSGQPGTGARDVGRLVAQHLQLDYIDQEILVEAARALGVPMESVVPFDERTASLGERLASMLRRFLERSAAAGPADPMLGAGGLDTLLSRTYAEAAADESRELSDERYVRALTDIARDLARHDGVLILGRGSQVILADWPGAFHALLIAPLGKRIEAFAAREDISADEAAKRVQEHAKGRAAFHRKFFKIEVDDPCHYHLVLNTACLSTEAAAEIIANAARRATPSATAS